MIRNLPGQHVAAFSIMPGQVRDTQPGCRRITRPPAGLGRELNLTAHDDDPFGLVSADESETVSGPHRTLLDKPSDDGAAALSATSPRVF